MIQWLNDRCCHGNCRFKNVIIHVWRWRWRNEMLNVSHTIYIPVVGLTEGAGPQFSPWCSLQYARVPETKYDHIVQLQEREMFLFNDALNTFYLRLYGVRHMVKDHSDSEKGNLLPPHRLLLSINSKGSFICTIPQTVEHWLEREIAQWVHPMKDRSNDPSYHERTLYLWATSRSLFNYEVRQDC